MSRHNPYAAYVPYKPWHVVSWASIPHRAIRRYTWRWQAQLYVWWANWPWLYIEYLETDR
jgi:hypothetical protein